MNPDRLPKPPHSEIISAATPTRRPVKPKQRDYNFAEEKRDFELLAKRYPKSFDTEGSTLFDDDDHLLAELQQAFQMVKDRVRQVVHGMMTGFVLSGRGGIGKSHIVREALAEQKIEAVYANSQITAKGLFAALREAPGAIHVVEDAEQSFQNPVFAGLMRSALWSSTPRAEDGSWPRPVTWLTSKGSEQFDFLGGLIVLANRPLPDTPEMQAVKTRIPHLDLIVTDPLIAALMRKVSAQGYVNGQYQLTADDCFDVCDFIVEQAEQSQMPLHMRSLIHGFNDRCSFDAGVTKTHWTDMIRSHLQEQVVPKAEPRSVRVLRELSLLRSIYERTDDKAERQRLFRRSTKLSRATYHRRRADLEAQLAEESRSTSSG